MLIFICGFMGAGKSTFLKRLKDSESGDVIFLDTDEEINRRYNGEGSLANWIESVGWEHFRKTETLLIEELLKNETDAVVALGGGALSSENLDRILNSSAKLIWLKTPYEVCCVRIEGDAHRPLVGKGEKYLQELYAERELRYAQSHLHLGSKEQQEITFQGLRQRLKLDE